MLLLYPNVVVQRCFSNFKTGDKFKRLRNEYGFTMYDNLLSRSVCDKFRLQFQ